MVGDQLPKLTSATLYGQINFEYWCDMKIIRISRHDQQFTCKIDFLKYLFCCWFGCKMLLASPSKICKFLATGRPSKRGQSSSVHWPPDMIALSYIRHLYIESETVSLPLVMYVAQLRCYSNKYSYCVNRI